MYPYRENIQGMEEAMSRKRNKYQRVQKSTEKSADNIIDLTGIGTNVTPAGDYREQRIDDNGDDITVTYFNSDGSTRTFRSQINTQTERSKQSGIRSKLAGDSDNTNNSNQPIFMTASEDKGNGFQVEDEYKKHDPESMADKLLESTGATILHSEVTLTDSSGNTRTFVRRKNDVEYYY